MAPTVSVAVPVYNGAAHLAECLASVNAQTVTADEVMVFDNASTDGSVALAAAYVPESAIIRSPTNQGAVPNFNLGPRTATGEFFMWVAADDRVAPRFIEASLETLAEHPLAPACLTGVQFIDHHGRPTRTQTDELLASEEPRVRLRAFLRRRRWTEFYCLYRRDRLLESPMMTPEYATDVLLTWWFLLRGPLAVTPELLLEYREYPDKTVAETASSLNPNAAVLHWRKQALWRRLHQMTADPGVDAAVGKAARRELVLAITHHTWWIHFAEDVLVRWPAVDRGVKRVWSQLGSPGRLAPPP